MVKCKFQSTDVYAVCSLTGKMCSFEYVTSCEKYEEIKDSQNTVIMNCTVSVPISETDYIRKNVERIKSFKLFRDGTIIDVSELKYLGYHTYKYNKETMFLLLFKDNDIYVLVYWLSGGVGYPLPRMLYYDKDLDPTTKKEFEDVISIYINGMILK